MPLPKGTKAPDFTLKRKTPEGLVDVRLSDNFGRKQTVLLFFPFAFSGGCTAELCDVSAGLSAYEALEADVIGVSIDSPHSQDAWAKQHDIRLKLASDLNKTVTRSYDVVFQHPAGETAARAAFVIGKDGVIKYSEQTPTLKDMPDFEAVKAALA